MRTNNNTITNSEFIRPAEWQHLPIENASSLLKTTDDVLKQIDNEINQKNTTDDEHGDNVTW